MTLTLPTATAAEVLEDPLAVAARVRPDAWGVRTEEGLVVLDHPQCEAALQNDALLPGVRRLLADMGLKPEDLTGGGRTMLMSEGADHTALRRVVGRWFTPRRVDVLADEVRALVDGLLDGLIADGGGDFLHDVARRVPGVVFCRLIGADPSFGERAYAMAEVLLRSFEGDPEMAGAIFEAGMEMRQLVEELLEAKRAEPGDDLLSIMLAAGDAGEIGTEDVHALVMEMLGASTETTAHSAALAIATLGAHPDEWAKVVADRSLVPRAVEETLRVEPAVIHVRLFPNEPTELAGAPIAAGEMVSLSVLAAHNDPNVYPEPERFDVTREHARPTLTFGIGRHYCLGAALARMELRVMVDAMAARCPTFELGDEVALDRGEATHVLTLPVTVGAR